MSRMQTRTLVEASLLAALAAVIMIASVYIPIISLVGAFVWPIPIVILAFKYDVKTSLLSLIVSLVIASIIASPVEALTLGLSYGLTAIVLGYCLRKKYSPFITIIAMGIATFIGYIAVIELTKLVTGVDAIKDFFTMFDESMKQSAQIMKGLGVSEDQIKNSPAANLNSNYLRLIFPGILALASITGSFLTYLIVEKIFKKLKYNINDIKPMDQWYIGNSLSFGLFFISIVSIILVYFKVPNSDIVYASVFSIFGFTFQIGGLAIVVWFLKSRGMPKSVVVLLSVFIIFSGLSQILFFIGLADYIIDFRKINPARRRRIPPQG